MTRGTSGRAVNKAKQDPIPRRLQIIKAAGSLFLRKGLLKTTVREIARESGITVGTLYHYIRTKSDIMSLIMDEELAIVNDFIREGENALSKLGPVEALRLTIERYFRMTAEIQDLNLFWYQETKNLSPDQRRRLLEYEHQFAETFNRILVAGCKTGDFRNHDTLLTAHDIIVLGDMWAFRRWFLGKHCTLDEFLKHQTGLILSGICNNSSSPGRRQIENRGNRQRRR